MIVLLESLLDTLYGNHSAERGWKAFDLVLSPGGITWLWPPQSDRARQLTPARRLRFMPR